MSEKWNINPYSETEELEIEINYNYKFADETQTQTPYGNIFSVFSTNSDTLKCDFCVMTCNDQKDLKKHVAKAHKKSKKFTDEVVYLKSSFKIHTEYHLKIDTTITNEHKTINCNSHLKTQPKALKKPLCSINGNLGIHNGELKVTCYICNEDFYRKNLLEQHMKRHLENKNYNYFDPVTCKICNKSFTTKTQLDNHLETHKETVEQLQKATCYLCYATFSRKYRLAQHLNRHLGIKPYKCLHCKEGFFTADQLYYHKTSTHSNYNPRRCKICNRSFPKNYKLNKHLKTHTKKQYSYFYPVTHKTRLYNDLKTLNVQTSRLKPTCNKDFSKKWYPIKHMNIRRPYKCQHYEPITGNKCNKSFTTKSVLNRHFSEIHRGSKFSCYICERVFSRKNTLKQHMNIHTGNSANTCQYCEKVFSISSSLQKHQKYNLKCRIKQKYNS